jgi:hypothetical protein
MILDELRRDFIVAIALMIVQASLLNLFIQEVIYKAPVLELRKIKPHPTMMTIPPHQNQL